MQKYKFRKLKKEDEKEWLELFRVAPLSRSGRTPIVSIKTVIEYKNYYPRVLIDEKTGKIVSYGSICFGIGSVNDGIVGSIQDVVTHPDHTGRGLAKRINQELLKIAKREKICSVKVNLIWLTCGEERESAYHIYKTIGFEEDDTRFMVKKL